MEDLEDFLMPAIVIFLGGWFLLEFVQIFGI